MQGRKGERWGSVRRRARDSRWGSIPVLSPRVRDAAGGEAPGHSMCPEGSHPRHHDPSCPREEALDQCAAIVETVRDSPWVTPALRSMPREHEGIARHGPMPRRKRPVIAIARRTRSCMTPSRECWSALAAMRHGIPCQADSGREGMSVRARIRHERRTLAGPPFDAVHGTGQFSGATVSGSSATSRGSISLSLRYRLRSLMPRMRAAFWR